VGGAGNFTETKKGTTMCLNFPTRQGWLESMPRKPRSHKILAGGLIWFAAASSVVFAQIDTQEAEVVTRFGTLAVGRDKTLEFKGRPLDPPIRGNNSLSLGESIRVGPRDVVLVRDNGGTACPYLYYFVTVTESGAKATPSFGTCGKIEDVKLTGKTISVVMPGYRGPFEPQKERREAQKQKHTFVFRDGVVKETGKAN
jgi:hypothetical protein